IVEAPNQGASSRAAAISAPRLAAPTTTTISSSGGQRPSSAVAARPGALTPPIVRASPSAVRPGSAAVGGRGRPAHGPANAGERLAFLDIAVGPGVAHLGAHARLTEAGEHDDRA